MKFLLAIALVLLAQQLEAVRLACNSASEGALSKYYCLSVDNSSPTACAQCAAGVKYWCPTSPLLSTRSWKRGMKVLGNCASIPRYTAIGTFPDGVNYSGHAAVFLSCSGTTIKVVDQWDGKTWGPRDIWNTAGTVSNNPNGFYVIEY